MDDIKIQRDDPGFLGSIFGKKRKSYSEIMNTFLTVKDDLKKLIKNNDADIADIEKEIEQLEEEKSVVVEEKGKAVETLAFLDKMVKE